MTRTQVFLRRDQARWLDEHAQGDRTKASLVREALDRFIASEAATTQLAPKDDPEYQAALNAGFGMWADRDDLDELFGKLRAEADRIAPGGPWRSSSTRRS